jgi:hypothetical protein
LWTNHWRERVEKTQYMDGSREFYLVWLAAVHGQTMATRIKQKTKCMILYAKHSSVVHVQLEFKGLFNTRRAPTSQRIPW